MVWRFGLVIGLLLLLIVLMLPARAADDYASLAAQIRAANISGSGAITLNGDITLSGALPTITGDLTVEGRGHSISGNDQFRIFDINGGSLTTTELTLRDGRANAGGAIRMLNGARVTIESSTLRGNMAETMGGGIYALGSSLTIRDSHFEKNCVKQLEKRINLGGQGEDWLAQRVDADGCLIVTRFRSHAEDDSEAAGEGGAVALSGGAQALIEGATFRENKATTGGAIAASNSSQLNIARSSFVGNQSSLQAGALSTGSGATTISKSSFVMNATSQGGGAIASGFGKLTISNSTFSENQTASGVGALALHNRADATITHASFVNNWSLHGQTGAIEKGVGARLRLRNSIIMGSSRGEDCVGGLDQNIGNLSADGSCAIKAIDDPLLGELTGSPAYHPPLDHSPAIDQADPRFCPETDQLGTARNKDSCDIGAIEATGVEAAPPPIVPPPVCSLADQIIAANTDRAFGGCPAGHGADTITLTRNILLFAPLPAIRSAITIDGAGHTISGDGKFRIFDVDHGNLAIKNLTMIDGSAPSGIGGAIRLQNGGWASVSDASFIGNQADLGGAIGVDALGPQTSRLSTHRSRFVRNRAARAGGAIDLNEGIATITSSSFMANIGGYSGGGISLRNWSRLEASDSSFMDGKASEGGRAIAAHNGASATLTHITMYSRNPYGAGSELSIDQGGYGGGSSVRLRNSVIAVSGSVFSRLCTGNLAQNINNLIEGGACSPMLDSEPMLEAPGDDSTYIAPLPGSPLIRAGHPSFCADSDQIGNPRSISGRCDIGAIEALPVVKALADCRVKPTHTLNLRDEANGSIIGGVRQGLTLPALARTPGWFHVEQDDARGWISADYVKTEGACD